MMYERIQNVAFGLAAGGLMLASSSLFATTVHVYDLHKISKQEMHRRDKNTRYILHLGAFKNKLNAINYRNQIQKKIKNTVYVSSHSGSKKLYSVYVGSINKTQLSEVLLRLGHSPASPRKELSSGSKSTYPEKLIHQQPQSFEKKHLVKEFFSSDQLVTMLSGAVGWSTPGQTQTIFLQSADENTYINSNNVQALGFGELFVGIEKPVKEGIQSQSGVFISAAGMAKMKGQIWQFADPEFNNLNYAYKLNQLRFGLRSKWILDKILFDSPVEPYITGSLGLALNRSFDFNNTINIDTAVVNPNFQDHTQAAFSYSAGFGVQRELTSSIQVGLGYEMLDWGKSSLGTALGQTTYATLGMNHLYMHSALLSLSYHS